MLYGQEISTECIGLARRDMLECLFTNYAADWSKFFAKKELEKFDKL